MRILKITAYALAATTLLKLLCGGRTIPRKAVAVKPFDLNKYLGTWYEIARFDYRFEHHLDNVSATYTLNEDGTIRVDNKGYNYKKEKWEESVGTAKPVGDREEAKLKVSFFGPFYAGYNVIAIDKDYMYALVVGDDTRYLWLLSRETTMPEVVKKNYLDKAREIGCKTNKLTWTKHDKK